VVLLGVDRRVRAYQGAENPPERRLFVAGVPECRSDLRCTQKFNGLFMKRGER
jgi:hypothetical protein